MEWEETGYWYRDLAWEAGFRAVLEEEERNIPLAIASLDADPTSDLYDLYLTLVCADGLSWAYLSPYSEVVPPEVDVYAIGIWDYSTEAWRDGEYYEYLVAVTDDESSVYIQGRAQLRQLVGMIKKVLEEDNPNHLFIVGIVDLTGETGIELWGGFDPTGFEDALDYLVCY